MKTVHDLDNSCCFNCLKYQQIYTGSCLNKRVRSTSTHKQKTNKDIVTEQVTLVVGSYAIWQVDTLSLSI